MSTTVTLILSTSVNGTSQVLRKTEGKVTRNSMSDDGLSRVISRTPFDQHP